MATANTETIPTLHTNGVIEDGYDEEDKTKMRPADIDADMREMERRKRVELIMNSRLFREELERIIESQMRDGNNSAGLLQQISDMVGSRYNNHFFRNANCVLPINDIRGLEAMGFVKGEKILRCKLAALFRLIELYGWSQNIYNHVTARLSHQEEHFLVNPYGLLYSEVTASSLAKVDMQGNVIESGTTNFGVSVAGFKLHAAIYAFRPDLKCIVHLHTPSVLAVSSLRDGLLPLSQEAAVVGEVSLYAYTGTPTDSDERDKIARSLGPNNKVIFLTNYGALCCGETIEETFFNAYNIVSACETQLKVMPLGKDNLLLLSDETRKSMYDAARKMPENVTPAASNAPSATAVSEKRWRVGGLEFEALMRMLDNAGFRTGYIYRTPLIKGELPRPRNDVEVPPAVSSLGYLLEEEELYKQGALRKHFANKGNDRIRWLNSPNVYQKVEILETGTSDPRKITKWVGPNNEEWVAEGSPSHTSTPVKIEHALQFVPKNTNPKEFKKLQQQIKDNRRADKITSGPQSHILEGVSWEEAKKLQDANMSGTSDQVILVGAASKGIIQREYQHNATVYKTPYAKNPFDTVTDEELENYKKDISRKQRGSSYYDEDESDSLPVKGITSETEDDSLPQETRVIRIQTSTAPKESRAEVVLSDDGKKSKNKFMHSLGSMLSLRRELATFVDKIDVLSTSMWEVRKFHPTKGSVATIKVVSYPAENGKPIVLRVNSDDDSEIQLFDLDSIVRSYQIKERSALRSKLAFKDIFNELACKFKSGDIFRRDARSSFCISVSCDSKPLAIESFDSSEVEFITVEEIPRPSHFGKRRSDSPHDFSSSGTTEDEEESLSSPGSGAELEPSLSLSSLTSCIGAEYEEWKVPHLELTLAETQELTTSFKSASDDTSMEDVTVIYRSIPSADERSDNSNSSDNGQSIIDNLSLDSEEDEVDENPKSTYSRYSDLDYEESMPQSFQYTKNATTTTSQSREMKFCTDLSVIYEEERITVNEELKSGEKNLEMDKQCKENIFELSEGAEDIHSACLLSGYESASTFDANSWEMEDSIANVRLSPERSDMTWTVDDLSSVDEVELDQQSANKELIVKSEEDLPSLVEDKIASFEEIEYVDQVTFVVSPENSSSKEVQIYIEDNYKKKEMSENVSGNEEILHQLDDAYGEMNSPTPTKDEIVDMERVQFLGLGISKEESYKCDWKKVNVESKRKSKDDPFLKMEASHDDSCVSSKWSTESEFSSANNSCNETIEGDYYSTEELESNVKLANSENDIVICGEKNNYPYAKIGESNFCENLNVYSIINKDNEQVEKHKSDEIITSTSLVNEYYIVKGSGMMTKSIHSKASQCSSLERTILFSHLLLEHVASYIENTADIMEAVDSTHSEETVALCSQNLISLLENPVSDNTLSDSSLQSYVADFHTAIMHVSENSETSFSDFSMFESLDHNDLEKTEIVLGTSGGESKTSETAPLSFKMTAEVCMDSKTVQIENQLQKQDFDEIDEVMKNKFENEDSDISEKPLSQFGIEYNLESLQKDNEFEKAEFYIVKELHSKSEDNNCDLCEKKEQKFCLPEEAHTNCDNETSQTNQFGDQDFNIVKLSHLLCEVDFDCNKLQAEDELEEQDLRIMDGACKEFGTDYNCDIFLKKDACKEQEFSVTDKPKENKFKEQDFGDTENTCSQFETECYYKPFEKEDILGEQDIPIAEEQSSKFEINLHCEGCEEEDINVMKEPHSQCDIYFNHNSLQKEDEFEEHHLNPNCQYETDSDHEGEFEQRDFNARSELYPQFESDSDHNVFVRANDEFNQQEVDINVETNPSVSCQYDFNQNEVTISEDMNTNTIERHTNSKCGDFKLTLSLHIEWDDKPQSNSPISEESTPQSDCIDHSGINSSTISDSFEDTDAELPQNSHRYIRSLYILNDFKQNYPKFIQYSDFSPKVKLMSRYKCTPRKWPFTPRCKHASAFSRSKTCARNSCGRFMDDDGTYHQYPDLSVNMPSCSHQSTQWSVDELPNELLASKSTNLSNLGDLRSGMHMVASTPTDIKKQALCDLGMEACVMTSTSADMMEDASSTCLVSSRNLTSLEEFELYESLFEKE